MLIKENKPILPAGWAAARPMTSRIMKNLDTILKEVVVGLSGANVKLWVWSELLQFKFFVFKEDFFGWLHDTYQNTVGTMIFDKPVF